MFEKEKYIMYKMDVCKIKDIKENTYAKRKCYILEPLFDNSLTISVPIDNENGYIRNLLTKDEIEKLIDKIPNIKTIDLETKNIENEYKNLIHSNKHEDLITIIKTSYLRNKKRTDNKKNISQKDKEYFEKAEKYLYNEFSVVLNLSYEKTKQYVIDKIEEKEEL